jgi:cell division protein FtsW (lipid II flippase)
LSTHQFSSQKIERQLLLIATGILFLFAAILSLSPASQERSWYVSYRWSHWAGFVIWTIMVFFGHWHLRRKLPDTDPFVYPLTGFLVGIGILSIWRIAPAFGFRQSLWFVVSGIVIFLGVRYSEKLPILRRYKYILLVSGIFLTSLTLIFGTNPMGGGPRLWLGCCGVYLQPSEPLKLLLVIYLSAYLADNLPLRQRFFPLILPTLLLTGLALLILVVQKDLGTASIFIFLYTIILYLATGRKRVILASVFIMALAAVVGYFAVDTIRIRLVAWLNPWSDPGGAGYQTIQSLMAIANGGIPGRGLGMGFPGLVPVAISDFIYSALAEETGFAGTIVLLCTMAIMISRGLRISLKAQDTFRRLLAGGLTAYLGAQCIVIIGGNLRLFPLTGVTLPFISYGGSSLVTSMIAILMILIIGSEPEEDPAPLLRPAPFLNLALFFNLIFLGLAITNSWWSIWRAKDLLSRTDNPRRSISDTYVARGNLVDRSFVPINETQGHSGSYIRQYLYPALGAITGYTNSIYGQNGLELSLDPYLRGLKGHTDLSLEWNQLLYGTPPPGLSVRLSISLPIQSIADNLLGDHKGSALLLNAKTGEVLAMASHPTFDPNRLSETGSELINDQESPLLNRAAQGIYPPGELLNLFNKIKALEVRGSPSNQELVDLYNSLGFYSEPDLQLPVSPASEYGKIGNLQLSPLQVALAATTLANNGIRSPGQIAMAVSTKSPEWIVLSPSSDPVKVFSPSLVEQTTSAEMIPRQPYWGNTYEAKSDVSKITWFIGGTTSEWQGTPLIAVIALEDGDSFSANRIGQGLLQSALEH